MYNAAMLTLAQECNFIYFNLTQIHRQSDATFINILQKLRVGEKLLSKEMKILLDHESNTEGGIEIYPTKSKVKDVNQKAFDKLEDTARKYKCEDNFDQRPQHADLNSLSNKGFGGTLAALVTCPDTSYITCFD
jgi:hemerythrin superfamily protein